VIVQGLVNDAARRDASALKLLFALMDRYRDGHDQEVDAAQMQPNDIAIIDSFLASMKAQETCAPPNDKNNEGRGSPASPEMKAPPVRHQHQVGCSVDEIGVGREGLLEAR
jgi:hypothetical protein